jgi:hypothetical protein
MPIFFLSGRTSLRFSFFQIRIIENSNRKEAKKRKLFYIVYALPLN